MVGGVKTVALRGAAQITTAPVIPTKAKPRGGIFAPDICAEGTTVRRPFDSAQDGWLFDGAEEDGDEDRPGGRSLREL